MTVLREQQLPLGGRLRAYAKLAKLSFYDYYLCVFVVWALLDESARTSPRTFAVLLLFDLGWVGVVAATVTLDDVTGYRDGSDDRNYAPGAVLRDRARKPLLNGSLTVGQALRFGYAAALWGTLCWAAAILVAPHRPVVAIAAAAFSVLISVQYSYGLRLSYRGGQELVILLSTGLCVLIPYWLLAGELNGLALLESFLFGLWSLLVSVYSNVNDVEGDRAAGRRNLATLVSPGTYGVLIGLLTLLEPVAIVITLVAGAAPLWFGLFLLPVLALRVRQVNAGLVRNQPLAARKLGITAHRTGVVVLVAANLLVLYVR
ncbi:MAG TPA: UbiA family prenyltransferase [Actinoplanes sp.]|jgi:1,4-dihydroxy-2-naphthoate octaprenyltransferase